MMTTSLKQRKFLMTAMMSTLGSGAVAQEPPLIPSFPSVIINRLWDENGDLRATHVRTGAELTIRVRRATNRPVVDSGWAGVCVQNVAAVNLTNFTNASAIIEVSARVVMDVKLERTRFQDGTILLMNHGTVAAGAPRQIDWNLRAADELGSGTLAQARRMCFYVLADGFPPGQDEVAVKIRGVTFDHRK